MEAQAENGRCLDLPDVEILKMNIQKNMQAMYQKQLQITKEFYQQENIPNMQEQLLH